MNDGKVKRTDHSPGGRIERLDNMLFTVVAVLVVLTCILLAFNLYLQWANYSQGIAAALRAGTDHAVVLTYSRAMDFAFTKTSALGLGFVLVFVGALFLLRVNEVAYSLGITGNAASVNLQTASPGLVLASLGVLTILATMYSKSYLSVQTPKVQSAGPLQSVKAVPDGVGLEDLAHIQQMITFNPESSELTNEGREALQDLCRYIGDWGVTKLQIEGHSDAGQPRLAAMAIREQRANVVRDALALTCPRVASSVAVSYGEERPGVLSVGNSAITLRILEKDVHQ